VEQKNNFLKGGGKNVNLLFFARNIFTLCVFVTMLQIFMLFSYGTNAALDRINSVWGGRSRGKIA